MGYSSKIRDNILEIFHRSVENCFVTWKDKLLKILNFYTTKQTITKQFKDQRNLKCLISWGADGVIPTFLFLPIVEENTSVKIWKKKKKKYGGNLKDQYLFSFLLCIYTECIYTANAVMSCNSWQYHPVSHKSMSCTGISFRANIGLKVHSAKISWNVDSNLSVIHNIYIYI